jgi:two-component system, LuxR family, sensor kinase FixL
MICSSMQEKHPLALDEDFQRLTSLAKGLERIASLDLLSRVSERLEDVDLREVLDNLRIVIEPDWRDVDGAVNWQLPDQMPIVVADPHGLLQAFVNLARNSHRAVQESSLRELTVTVIVEEQKAIVRFADTGTGIAAPERLFEPFQPGAEGTGLGLYVSRAVVRSYGGELRYEPQNAGSCFAIELQVA